MNELTAIKENGREIFTHELFGRVRIMIMNKEPFFNLHDVAFALGYVKENRLDVQYLRKDRIEKICQTLDITGVSTADTRIAIAKETDFETTYISESDLYDLVFESNAQHARNFRKWVTTEVLPTIRKTGAYGVSEETKAALEQLDMMVELMESYKHQNEEFLKSKKSIENQVKKLAKEMDSKGKQLDWILKAASYQISQTFEVFGKDKKLLSAPSEQKLLEDTKLLAYRDALEFISVGSVGGAKLSREMMMEIATNALEK